MLTIIIYKYYYDCPKNIVEYKYINRSCSNTNSIPTSLLFKNLFENSDEWIGYQSLYSDLQKNELKNKYY